MNNKEDIVAFIDDLPIRLQTKTVMYVYKEVYTVLKFLKDGSESFLTWVCPLLKQTLVSADQAVYYESDIIDDIYFQLDGLTAFVVPFDGNVVYIEIEDGDTFGDIDFIASGKASGIEIKEIIESIDSSKLTLTRYFTVFCIKESNLMTISVQNLHRMSKQFNSEFF